jgi:hypothetical protein
LRAGGGGGGGGGGGEGGGGGGGGGGGRSTSEEEEAGVLPVFPQYGGIPVTCTSIADTRACQEAHILKSNLFVGLFCSLVGLILVHVKKHIF